MSFNAVVLSVFIASPGDVDVDRNTVEDTVRRWNADRARDSGVMLLPLRWEINAVSDLRIDAQTAINEQLVDRADIVIGLFHSRLGTRTARALSGTAEELERSVRRGVAVHVYFSGAHLPSDLDIDQLAALRTFRAELEQRGLLGAYNSTGELESLVRTALEYDVSKLLRKDQSTDSGAGALFEVACVVERPASSYDIYDRRERLLIEVRNVGRVVAENLRLELKSTSGGELPINRLSDLEVSRLGPMDIHRFPVYRSIGMSAVCRANLIWNEGVSEFRSSHQVEFDVQ